MSDLSRYLDVTSWYVGAALFWFEAIGFMSLAAAVFLSPLTCWGDRITEPVAADDACASGQLPLVQSGIAAAWLGLLLVVGLAAVLLWVATARHPTVRVAAILVLGLAALVPIVVAARADPLLGLIVGVWTGVPAVLLLGSAASIIRRSRRAPPARK